MSAFSWNNFDEEFINSIVYSNKTRKELLPAHRTYDKNMLIPTMEKIAPYPTKQFVITYRSEIERKFLIKHPEILENIYKFQGSKKTDNYNVMLNELSKMPFGATIVNQYTIALSEIGCGSFEWEQSVFSYPITIDITKTIANEVPMHDYQEDAVKELIKFYIDEDGSKGMLVMPTGSGKTRTAVYFLNKYLISKGYQVIWLTHRHMLIDQTADTFYNLSPVVKQGNTNIKTFKMACISGKHSPIKATEKDDNVMIMSIQSVCRSLEYLRAVLAKKVVIVVDESHHTVAGSYTKTIDYIKKVRKNVKLLGLTATPIRGTENSSKFLLKYYDDKIIYDISMSELIKKQFLSTPNFIKIETNIDIEPFISIDEANLIKKYGEIPETLAEKIAHSSKRNRVIVDTYLNNKEKYGKTLIFALNGYHCFTLCEDLKKKGINCDYIYSGNNDNDVKIRKFKNNELDVLVNINIMTEGSDVPDIETIFLTRPTQSEGLLMQMIGRGMRGKLANGTEEVNIVDFCDKWDIFNKWLNPKWVFGDYKEELKTEVKTKPLTFIPWDLIRDIYKGITYPGEIKMVSTLALPLGWYTLIDETGEDYTLFVWQEQLKGYQNMIKDKKDLASMGRIDYDGIINKYFGGFVQQPSKQDVELFAYNLLGDDISLHFFRFENRRQIDPTIISEDFKKENIGIADLEESVRRIYNENENIISNIYGDFESYLDSVYDCIRYKSGYATINQNIKEVPLELLPYKIEPTHDLEELAKEVINEMFNGVYEGISSIRWTDRPYSTYYGLFYPGGIVKINKMLDSPEVDREVIKFLIYHEFLHRDYRRHDKSFYIEEHKFPNYTEHNRFLDYKINNYKLEF